MAHSWGGTPEPVGGDPAGVSRSTDSDAVEPDGGDRMPEDSDLEQLSQPVVDVLSVGIPVPLPVSAPQDGDGERPHGDGPVSGRDGQPSISARATGTPGASAVQGVRTDGLGREEEGAASTPTPPLDRELSHEAAKTSETRGRINGKEEALHVAESRANRPSDVAISRTDAGNETAHAAAPPPGEALRRPPLPVPAAQVMSDEMQTSTVSTATAPVPADGANAPSAHVAAQGFARSGSTAGGRATFEDGAPQATSEAVPTGETDPDVAAAQEPGSQNASQFGGGERGAAPRDGSHSEFAASRSLGSGPSPTMMLVQGPDGTLRLALAPLSELAKLPPTAQENAANITNLVQTMRVLTKSGVSEATVQLHPEHLGEVTIAIRVEGKSVSAVVNAESSSVRDWILSHESTLRSGLSEQGLHLDRLLVQRDPRHDRREQPRPEQRRARGRRSPEETQERFEVSA